MKTRTLKLAGVVILGMGALSGPAAAGPAPFPGLVLAQNAGAVPPRPGKGDDPPVVVTYGVMLLLAAGIIGANMIPSKRGHQD